MHKITSKFTGTRVLLAEDYVVNQELTKEMLNIMECDVDIAEDGFESIEMHTVGKYDIIFMDIQMPNMDGYEATKKIREMGGDKKDIPIIAITANAMTGDKEKCLNAGMDDYISKPIRGDQLEEMLKKYVKLSA